MVRVGLALALFLSLHPLQAHAQTAASELIHLWSDANERCRGGDGNSTETDAACVERQRYSTRLNQLGLCYGIEDQMNADRFWRPCTDRLPRSETPRQTAQAYCVVDDPTPTPLNVRTAPYGRVLGTIRNGNQVTIVDRANDAQGKLWVYIAQSGRPFGWVYQQYVKCF